MAPICHLLRLVQVRTLLCGLTLLTLIIPTQAVALGAKVVWLMTLMSGFILLAGAVAEEKTLAIQQATVMVEKAVEHYLYMEPQAFLMGLHML
jgi:hypothetical protein